MKVDKKTVLAIVLGIAAVGIIMYQLRNSLSSGSNAINAAVAAPTPSRVAPGPQATMASTRAVSKSPAGKGYAEFITTIEEKQLAFKSGGFRNPMTPLVSDSDSDKQKAGGPAAKVALGPSNALALGYTIKGIVWNEAAPLAIVNEQVVGVGEQLDDGSRVTEITRDTVRFTKHGRNYFLVFREE